LSEYITPTFITDLVYLLNSYVMKERKLISEILLSIYEKLVNKRKIIRSAIVHCCENIIYDDEEFNGTTEILDFYSLVIRGFVTPLKQANIDFFVRTLIPLHKLRNMHTFINSLVDCCKIYIMKDNFLANTLIDSLVRYMPFGNSAKEGLFLSEIEEIINLVEPKYINQSTFVKLCRRLSRSAKESSFLVAVKSISLVNNQSFFQLIFKWKEMVKLFYPALDKLFQCDIDDEYYDLLTLVEFKLSKIDQDTYEDYLKKKDEHNGYKTANENIEKWNVLGQLVKDKCGDFKLPTIPYNENTSLSNFSQIYHRFAIKM